MVKMEDQQFEVEGKTFKCVECETEIEVVAVTDTPRPVTCEKCETEYFIVKNDAGGLMVTVNTASEPDVITQNEANLEEEDTENPNE